MAEQNEISIEIEEERGPIPAHPGAVECRIPHPVDLFDECDNIFMHKDREGNEGEIVICIYRHWIELHGQRYSSPQFP